MSRDVTRHSVISPGTLVMVAAVGLLVATVAVLVLDGAGPVNDHRDAARRFQRMAGGLGLGATVCPRWCFVNFDPRLERCTCAEQPLPGGYCYCPEHGGTVSFFPPVELESFRPGILGTQKQARKPAPRL